ncbi:hypothetical protein ACHRV3_22590, partial [Flavobacterium sp. FlaQc-49]|uniref:hypothetical protein n=1 Tax=Flavobacterium sp. FlaQc-49 TaxID=3374182 RepID=UPI0037583A92
NWNLGFFIELNKLEFEKKVGFDFAQPDTWGGKTLRLCDFARDILRLRGETFMKTSTLRVKSQYLNLKFQVRSFRTK